MKPVTVPALDLDAAMLEKYGQQVSDRGQMERSIVAHLIDHLDRRGFVLSSVWDGEELSRVADMKAAMELVFNLDEVSVRFVPKGMKPGPRFVGGNRYAKNEHGVFLVLGNGRDIVSDWNFNSDDADGFNAAMDAFDVDAIVGMEEA